jgi:hypothetical protein
MPLIRTLSETELGVCDKNPGRSIKYLKLFVRTLSLDSGDNGSRQYSKQTSMSAVAKETETVAASRVLVNSIVWSWPLTGEGERHDEFKEQ